MTSPERIEELLQTFGQTLKDLPKPNEYEYAYETKDKQKAQNMVMEFEDIKSFEDVCYEEEYDFICHQSDVIEKLVMALEIANEYSSIMKGLKDEN